MANSKTGTSSINTLGEEYEVFLSFRGSDTRHGFTNCLYHALKDVGIHVFIDDEKLRPGERISDSLPRAIDDSKLYIPIFSKNYASSHWCLRELAKMVENSSISKEDEKKVILPIFYDVTPNDVKLKTTLYSKALSNLEQKIEDSTKKFRFEDVETWRQALKEVDDTKGWELQKYSGFGDLINLVVNEVVVRLKTKQRKVTKELVGMEDHIAVINNLLDVNSSGVRLIGIYGISGIGKTTLAKIIFNKLCPHFGKHCSFLDNVSETAETKGFTRLQEQLLLDISHSRVAQNISNSDHGIDMIARTICNKKVLIVLDDVEDGNQIQKLIGVNPLCTGTRILVTTRDRSVLNIRGLKYKFKGYEMVGLNNEDALQLFSRHAFDDNSPLADYYILSKDIVSIVGGLPLALEAIGSLLFCQEKKKIWKEKLDKLRKTPHEDILGKLRISYDALEPDQQQIFLDVACFFIGQKKTNTMYLWEDCGFGPEDAIDVLTKRCMIKILEDDRFEMHNQFRDLGRVIAKIDGTRLWDRNDIICEFQSEKIKASIQALRLPLGDLSRPPIIVTSEQIKRFPHLQFLWLDDVICQGDFTGDLSELKWISLHPRPFHHQCFEATILLHLENVVVVNLSNLDFTNDVLESLIKGARKLKVLTLHHNRLICGIPTFPEVSILEKLTISECPSLMEIDCSIGKLRYLTDLSFESCLALGKLPEQIEQLQNLQHLSVRNCASLSQLPYSVLEFRHEYQVFLSFRGPDTRHGFTNSLYHALVDAEIQVFIDDEEFRLGKSISSNLLHVIDDSKLYIPIFSKNYASSHWCLRELAKIVENTSKSKEDGKKFILPIFYDVTPDDVKLKTALYKKAISNLEQKMEHQNKKFGSKDVEMWRRALKQIDGTKGWELKKYPSYEDLIPSVVNEVLVKLKTRNVTKDLIGMEDQIACINKLLDIDSGGVRIIGIHGMSGIGKTVLAKFIFNQLCPRFGENYSFLDDVSEMVKTKGLVKLQEQLLSDISHSRVAHDIDNIDQGMNMIEETICNKKMLIVLDNVDEKMQIIGLLGVKSLCSGTRILITTRDVGVMHLRESKYYIGCYKMEGLSEKDALQLFSRHAFNDSSPPANYYTLSKSILSTANGLPAALKAIGSSLFGQKNKEIWEERLGKLRKSTHKSVLEKLRISFDALECNEKEIFLDVACFSIGQAWKDLFYLWKDDGYFPFMAIDVLIKRCMIMVSDNNTLWMNNQFRDLGRAIVNEQNPQFPGEHTRLWDRDDIIHKLRSTEIKHMVQAIYLRAEDGNPITVTAEQIGRFPGLRVLWMSNVICEGDFNGCLSMLKWITLQSSTYRYEPINLRLENVVVANLSLPDFNEDELSYLLKEARKLKVLTLQFNKSIHGIPTFSAYSVLEKLTIFKCPCLMEIDCSIEELRYLTVLSVESCSSLGKLPEQIGKLHHLQQLSLRYCHNLRELPDSISQLEQLIMLDISYTSITRLPDSISKLSSLSSANLSHTPVTEMPSTMTKLLHVTTLDLDHCHRIQDLPELPRSLATLRLRSTSLLTVPNLSNLTDLVELLLSNGSEATVNSNVIQTCDLRWIGRLSKLRKLHFCFPNVRAPATELGSLYGLTELTLYGLDLPTFNQLPPKLTVIELFGTRVKKGNYRSDSSLGNV